MFFSLEMLFFLGWFGLVTVIKPRIHQHFEFFASPCAIKSRFFKV